MCNARMALCEMGVAASCGGVDCIIMSAVNPHRFTTRPEITGTFGVIATTHWLKATRTTMRLAGSVPAEKLKNDPAVRAAYPGAVH
jgi:hypothetical protein